MRKESLSPRARQLVDYLEKLDADSQVETRHHIECALQGQDIRNLSTDITRYSPEVLMEVRHYLQGTFEDPTTKKSPDSN